MPTNCVSPHPLWHVWRMVSTPTANSSFASDVVGTYKSNTWTAFVRDNNLHNGDMLIFTHVSARVFNVTRFLSNGCLPYYPRGYTDDSSSDSEDTEEIPEMKADAFDK
ncbi:uncharacterized protein LOC125201528 [Salvia hispanica]|uniref:uncharacterized protein LOC125201528 n=1 Tax=Salvia hispanica TaxID=49212 RepID=UPI00200994E0|nr:uncharacterized protein LOC125201528 [Salvia hispanica]